MPHLNFFTIFAANKYLFPREMKKDKAARFWAACVVYIIKVYI